MRWRIKLVVLWLWMGLFTPNLCAQQKYWVNKRDTSLLSSTKAVFCSEWLPYCSYAMTPSEIALFTSNNPLLPVAAFAKKNHKPSTTLGFALEQIEAQVLLDLGLTGKGVKIGIIDGGFLNASSHPALSQLFDKGSVISYTDYITPEMLPYKGSKHLDDAHGADVWSLIGGYNPTTNVISGIATDAHYYLARTDHGAFEKRLEEDLLIKAMENMHQQGVRLINVSLGYADGYTRPDENYQPNQMDGKTSLLAMAVDTAFFKKNMLIVVSAGNEGDRESWKVVSTPGDARGALTVGASILDGTARMKYSSIGTPGIGYIKPEVVCFASNGTSFSAPVITGLAAAIMQYDSSLSAAEIKDLIIRSSSLYPHGNNHLGYGVPKATRLLQLIKNDTPGNEVEYFYPRRKRQKVTNLQKGEQLRVLHKNIEHEVISETSLTVKKRNVRVKYSEGINQSTILIENQHFEIIWRK